MASPSSAKIPVGSSTKQVRASKRDVGRSRVIGASSVSNSSRRVNGSVANVNGGASGHGSGHSTRVYLDGVDVTPQSLLVSRIKPSTPSGGYDPKAKGKGGKGSRTKAVHGVGASVAGASMAGASMLFSHASSSSADNDSDSESSSSVVATAARGVRKEVRPSGGDRSVSSSATPTSNQEEDDSSRASNGAADPEDREDGKDEGGDPLLAASGLAVDRAAPLLVGGKSASNAMGLMSGRSRRVPVTVTLAETSTEMLLEIRSVCVAQDAPNHTAVTARNKRYQAVCAQKKGSEKFVEGRAQTLQLAQKAKEVMTAPPATRDVACVATDWDIYDCAKMEEENNNETDEVGVGESAPSSEAQAQTQSTGTSTEGQPKDPNDATLGPGAAASGAEGGGAGGVGDVQLKQQVEEIVGATLASPGCVLDVDGDIVEDLRARQHHSSKPNRKNRDKHGQSNVFSQKSRMFDSQRSTVVATAVSGNSNASVAIGEQRTGNLSAGASQDFAALAGGEGASSGSAATNSQVGMSVANASRGVLSGGPGGSGDAKSNNVYARANTNVDIGEIIARQRTSHVLGSSSLLLTANVVERAVQQNVYHQQHVRYRDFPILETAESPPEPVVPALGMGFPTRSDSFSGGSKTMQELEQLWAFRCELTKDRTVSCLAWNTANEDLLAVSYARAEPLNPTELAGPTSPSAANGASSVAVGGAASVVPASPAPRPGQTAQSAAAAAAAAGSTPGSTGESNDGLVLFWSLTNPEYPERIYHLPVGVTSIDFSTAHPYLLAVGFADGVVSIYDTRKADSSSSSGPSNSTPSSSVPGAAEDPTAKYVPVPIATSSGMGGKHLDAVWQVRWVARGGGESVVSVSSDGRVVEWSLKKGLSYSDLMTLKRSTNPLLGGAGTAATGASGIGDGVISRQASGRCLAFASRGDPSVYFVGTEDGLVHKCSVSYNEQYLQTYIGHTGPVYQLLVSPFCSDLFLSCSGDWSLKLWHQADPRGDAVLTFHSVDLAQAVLGASWSPSDAAVFAAVAEDGRIELWDLAQSTLDPIIRHFPKKFIAVAAPVPPPTDADGLDAAGTSREMTPKGGGDSDRLDDDTYRDPNAASSSVPAAPTMVEVPLECTTVAFAPKAPVLVVGDSTGDVTVYRVPAQVSTTCADSASDPASSVEEQAARLLRAIQPNKHE